MELSIFQVDAFAEAIFQGNPAAVVPLQKWLPDALLQSIAMENNLSETAYFVKNGSNYEIRWFTPKAEVELCGHATLASAFVIFSFLESGLEEVTFESKFSGSLYVRRMGAHFQLEFPVDTLDQKAIDPGLEKAFQTKITALYEGRTDYLIVLENQKAIEDLEPDFRALMTYEQRGFIVTAPGEHCDFVSRFFCPILGIDEDPVTGSAHTSLTPFWAERLGKSNMSALQLSTRGGKLQVALDRDRVRISGKAVLYMKGTINVNL
jgi:PhzF family phenazine biosynthesis protein